MYRKPHQKSTYRSVKKIVPEKEKLQPKQQPKKFVAKPAPNMTKAPKLPIRERQAPLKTVPQKVQQLQKLVDQIQKTTGNSQLQQMLLKEIQGIKSQLRDIKTQIGMKQTKSQLNQYQTNQYEQQGRQQEEQNIMNINVNSQLRQINVNSQNQHNKKIQNNSNMHISRPKAVASTHKVSKKVLLQLGKIQPYMKQFKIQAVSKQPQPFYHGYHKKSSKPVIIKYCQQSKNLDPIVALYQRFWKNIVKAKSICINKIYDLNQPLASYILVMDQNKCGLEAIQMQPYRIAQQVLRGLQFFHQCGYLYRNLQPEHVMQTYQGNIVLIDLKKMKRFIDIKGKVLDIKMDEQEDFDQFVANSRIRCAIQGRKDDLECLGYLTLYMMEGKLPWNQDNMIQIRSKMTLNQIFGKYPGLLKFMIEVNKLPTHEMPNYNMFYELLNP